MCVYVRVCLARRNTHISRIYIEYRVRVCARALSNLFICALLTVLRSRLRIFHFRLARARPRTLIRPSDPVAIGDFIIALRHKLDRNRKSLIANNRRENSRLRVRYRPRETGRRFRMWVRDPKAVLRRRSVPLLRAHPLFLPVARRVALGSAYFPPAVETNARVSRRLAANTGSAVVACQEPSPLPEARSSLRRLNAYSSHATIYRR